MVLDDYGWRPALLRPPSTAAALRTSSVLRSRTKLSGSLLADPSAVFLAMTPPQVPAEAEDKGRGDERMIYHPVVRRFCWFPRRSVTAHLLPEAEPRLLGHGLEASAGPTRYPHCRRRSSHRRGAGDPYYRSVVSYVSAVIAKRLEDAEVGGHGWVMGAQGSRFGCRAAFLASPVGFLATVHDAESIYLMVRPITDVFHTLIAGRVVAKRRAVAAVANNAQLLFVSVESSKLTTVPAATRAYITSSRPPGKSLRTQPKR